MFKKCKIVLLPSAKESVIGLYHNKLYNSSFGAKTDDWINQNIYVLSSDEEIKEGDWCYKTDVGGYDKYKNHKLIESVITNGLLQWVNTTNPWYKDAKKIIATTDSFITGYDGQPMDKNGNIAKQYPSIPQSFIDKYVSEYNAGRKIEEVMVEYGYNFEGDFDSITSKKEYNIRINLKDNSIIIL